MSITTKNFGSMHPELHPWKSMLNEIASGNFDKVYDLTPRNIAAGTFLCTLYSADNIFIRVNRANTEDGISAKLRVYSFEADNDGNTRSVPRPWIQNELEKGSAKALCDTALHNIALGIAEFVAKQPLEPGDIQLDTEASKVHISRIGDFNVFMDNDTWTFTLNSIDEPGKLYLSLKADELTPEVTKQLMPLIFKNQYEYIADTLTQHAGDAIHAFMGEGDLQAAIQLFRNIAQSGDYQRCCGALGQETAINTLMKTANALEEVKRLNYTAQPCGIHPHKINTCVDGINAMLDEIMQPFQEEQRNSIDELIAAAASTDKSVHSTHIHTQSR